MLHVEEDRVHGLDLRRFPVYLEDSKTTKLRTERTRIVLYGTGCCGWRGEDVEGVGSMGTTVMRHVGSMEYVELGDRHWRQPQTIS